MELRRDVLWGALALLASMALMAFGTIGLLSRMSPEIRRILAENVASVEAAERMMVVMMRTGDRPATDDEAAEYQDALAVLERNVTEPGEERLIAAIRADAQATLATDEAARDRTLSNLRRLVDVNRNAMRSADLRAQQLGVAGAWAVVLITLLGTLVSYVALRRLDRRVLAPITQLHLVLDSAARGETHRRCHAHAVPRELREVMQRVNELLDRHMLTFDTPHGTNDRAIRLSLTHLLDQQPEPVFVVARDGEMLAANARGLDVLSGPEGDTLRQRLVAAAAAVQEDGTSEDGELRAERIVQADVALCRLVDTSPDEAVTPI